MRASILACPGARCAACFPRPVSAGNGGSKWRIRDAGCCARGEDRVQLAEDAGESHRSLQVLPRKFAATCRASCT